MKNKIINFSILILLYILILSASEASSPKDAEYPKEVANVPVSVSLQGSGSDNAVVVAIERYTQQEYPLPYQVESVYSGCIPGGYEYMFRGCSNNGVKSGGVSDYKYIDKASNAEDLAISIIIVPQVCLY